MELQEKNKMETMPIGKLLFTMAVPTVLAQLVNLLYNIVDRIYVGKIEGEGKLALAGLGITFPIIMLVAAFASLIGMGGAPRAAILMGKKENRDAEKILGNCVTLLVLASIALTGVFFWSKEWILLKFGASQATLPYADSYLGIYLLGTLFVMLSLGLNMFLSSQGFTKMSMATVCIGALLNIVLDPLFIFGFQLGVRGAALATIISQAVSAVWVVSFLFGKRTILRIRRENFGLRSWAIKSILTLGISPFIMQATECLVQLIFNKGMLKYGNDDYVAVMAVLFSVMQLIWMPMQGVSQGAQPILSYNYGAGNLKRVKQTFRLLFIAAMGYSVATVSVIELFPNFFIRLFNDDPALLEIGTHGIRIFMAGMIIMGGQSACQQTFLALGEAKISMFLALLRKVILLIPLALILPHIMTPKTDGLYFAECIADVIAVITTVTLFRIKTRKLLTEREKTAKI